MFCNFDCASLLKLLCGFFCRSSPTTAQARPAGGGRGVLCVRAAHLCMVLATFSEMC